MIKKYSAKVEIFLTFKSRISSPFLLSAVFAAVLAKERNRTFFLFNFAILAENHGDINISFSIVFCDYFPARNYLGEILSVL